MKSVFTITPEQFPIASAEPQLEGDVEHKHFWKKQYLSQYVRKIIPLFLKYLKVLSFNGLTAYPKIEN